MSADIGSIQKFYPEPNELRLLAWRGFHPRSASFWERGGRDSASSCGVALSAERRIVVRMLRGVNSWPPRPTSMPLAGRAFVQCSPHRSYRAPAGYWAWFLLTGVNRINLQNERFDHWMLLLDEHDAAHD
jgi:hypothetical protein